MFLIRTAFWLSLVVLLLPSDAQQQARLYNTASDAASHAATFCDRNRSICNQGALYWASFQTKLEFGTRMAIDLASERLLGNKGRSNAAASITPAADTLTPADMSAPWRGRKSAGA